uniref:Apple domain-containing protein n=1 Tax=Rhabditophanes sp. KR3021 TaxID=114890 RepID=A0AC35TSK6_9BILA
MSANSPEVDSIVTEIADLTDPCFHKYKDASVDIGQPFERRSQITLKQCKNHCSHTQTGFYQCRSVVYNYGSQICDLFAHVGDQSPSRLIRQSGADYFEHLNKNSCLHSPNLELGGHESATVVDFNEDLKYQKTADVRKKETKKGLVNGEAQITATSRGPFSATCTDDKVPRYLKIKNFELYLNDDVLVEKGTFKECSEICNSNLVNDNEFKCGSFDLKNGTCYLSKEVSLPLGSGKLKQSEKTDYYEKVCVEEKYATNCPLVFERHPQKILVGFAETVIDVSTFQECFNTCLNAKTLFGFECYSGMFYFEESSLNCILNSESKATQPDLFTSEYNDIVDYFETGCKVVNKLKPSNSSNVRRKPHHNLLPDAIKSPKRDMNEGTILISENNGNKINKEFLKSLNPKWIVV